MTLKRLFRLLWIAFVAVLLFATTVAGLFDVTDNVPLIDTALKALTLCFQISYTISGAAALVGLVARRSWWIWALDIWAVSITLTATLAPPAWGGTGIGPTLAAGTATAFVTGMIVWWTHRIMSRHP